MTLPCCSYPPRPKALDVLERLDPAPEYLEGKKGACIGTFQVGPWAGGGGQMGSAARGPRAAPVQDEARTRVKHWCWNSSGGC